MPIYIDTRGDGEFEIGNMLQKMHIPIEFRHIDSGDYVFNDIAIERKTVADLINSVIGPERHFWNQLETMKATYKKPIVLIEGLFPMEDRQCSGIFYAIVGGWNIPVIFTMNRRESADRISKLFDKYGEGSQNRIPPAVVKKEASTKKIKWAMLQCVEGIGGVTAQRILEKEPLIISTACNYGYIIKTLKGIKGLTPKAQKRLEKVLFNED